MLHEFFSGKPPFSANSPNELLQRHLSNKPQPLTVFDKNITPEFAAYVLADDGQGSQRSPDQHEGRDDGNQNAADVLQPTATTGRDRRIEINRKEGIDKQEKGRQEGTDRQPNLLVSPTPCLPVFASFE